MYNLQDYFYTLYNHHFLFCEISQGEYIKVIKILYMFLKLYLYYIIFYYAFHYIIFNLIFNFGFELKFISSVIYYLFYAFEMKKNTKTIDGIEGIMMSKFFS